MVRLWAACVPLRARLVTEAQQTQYQRQGAVVSAVVSVLQKHKTRCSETLTTNVTVTDRRGSSMQVQLEVARKGLGLQTRPGRARPGGRQVGQVDVYMGLTISEATDAHEPRSDQHTRVRQIRRWLAMSAPAPYHPDPSAP